MNKRIKELIDQAGFIRFSAEEDPQTPIDWSCDYDLELEKFAELIVQECLDTIQRGIDNGGGASEDIVMAGKLALFYSYRNIQYRFGMGDYKDQEHFGVEEPKGWICPKCGTDRTKAVCPQGLSAAVDGRCPMIGFAQ